MRLVMTMWGISRLACWGSHDYVSFSDAYSAVPLAFCKDCRRVKYLPLPDIIPTPPT